MPNNEPDHSEARAAGEPDAGPEAPLAGKPEYRRHPRFRWPFVFGASVYGAVYDISVSGLCLAISAPVQVGAYYTLALTSGYRYQGQTLEAKVVWCRRGKAGLEWVDLQPEQRQWLEELCRDCEREQGMARLQKSVRFSL